MKKYLLFFSAIISSVICFIIIQQDSICASAVQLNLRTEYIYEDSSAYYYKVYVSMTNNTIGYNCGGLRVYSNNTYFEPIMDNNMEIAVEKYNSFNGMSPSFSYNEENGVVGCAFNSTESYTNNGDLFSFTLKSINKSDIENNPSIVMHVVNNLEIVTLMDSSSHLLTTEELIAAQPTHTQVFYYSYMIGDLNGDGYIDLVDDQLMQLFVSWQGSISVNTTLSPQNEYYPDPNDYPGLFIDTTEFTTILVLRVADVNGDGYVNSTDLSLLSEYYVNVILLNMAAPSGTLIGTVQSVYNSMPI